MATTREATGTSAEIARVGIREPPFFPSNPNLWFAQLEAQFNLNGITADNTRYWYVMSSLETGADNATTRVAGTENPAAPGTRGDGGPNTVAIPATPTRIGRGSHSGQPAEDTVDGKTTKEPAPNPRNPGGRRSPGQIGHPSGLRARGDRSSTYRKNRRNVGTGGVATRSSRYAPAAGPCTLPGRSKEEKKEKPIPQPAFWPQRRNLLVPLAVPPTINALHSTLQLAKATGKRATQSLDTAVGDGGRCRARDNRSGLFGALRTIGGRAEPVPRGQHDDDDIHRPRSKRRRTFNKNYQRNHTVSPAPGQIPGPLPTHGNKPRGQTFDPPPHSNDTWPTGFLPSATPRVGPLQVGTGRIPKDAPAGFVTQLRREMRELQPTPGSRHVTRSTFIYKELRTSPYVFLRHDATRTPLQPTYDGPYEVLERGSRTFIIKVNNKATRVTVERLKPAHLLNEDKAEETDSSDPEENITSIPSPIADLPTGTGTTEEPLVIQEPAPSRSRQRRDDSHSARPRRQVRFPDRYQAGYN
ncbi:hypothetical protein ANTPLA_LOCUS1288 [Anthophora plagiata]